MATSTTSTDPTSSSSSSSSRAATPASGPVTKADLTSDSLAADASTDKNTIALAGGRYSIMATSTPPGAIGLELQLADGTTTSYISNQINGVGANMQFSQSASIWLLPPGTYQIVASGPFTGGSLTITPF